MTDGGDGVRGWAITEEYRQKRRESSTGRKHSEASKILQAEKAKIREARKTAEQKEAISAKIRQAAYNDGRADTLKKWREIVGPEVRSELARKARMSLSPERRSEIAKNGLANIPAERRREIAASGAQAAAQKISKDQWKSFGKLGSVSFMNNTTPEQRKEISRKARAAQRKRTPEEIQAWADKIATSLTSEQKQARSIKSWETRRKNLLLKQMQNAA